MDLAYLTGDVNSWWIKEVPASQGRIQECIMVKSNMVGVKEVVVDGERVNVLGLDLQRRERRVFAF